jgi:hypothetical protein
LVKLLITSLLSQRLTVHDEYLFGMILIWQKMAVTDLKREKLETARYAIGIREEGIAHAFRQIRVFSGDGPPSHSHLSAVRQALPRLSQSSAT